MRAVRRAARRVRRRLLPARRRRRIRPRRGSGVLLDSRRVAVHFVHIGKTGGTAIKHVLRPIFRAETETALGKVILHKGHTFKLADVPRGDKAIFCVRDPLSLFVSAFHSRLRKGQPKFYFEWSPAEAAAFERFPTPQSLAEGLGQRRRGDAHGGAAGDEGDPAHPRDPPLPAARPSTSWRTASQIAYIGRQETLDDDWQRIRALLELPEDIELPSDPKKSHRRAAVGRPGARPATPRRSCATTTSRTTRSSPPATGSGPRTAGAASRRAASSRSRSRSAAEPWAPCRCPTPPCARCACCSPSRSRSRSSTTRTTSRTSPTTRSRTAGPRRRAR